jgi:hypothetical protein
VEVTGAGLAPTPTEQDLIDLLTKQLPELQPTLPQEQKPVSAPEAQQVEVTAPAAAPPVAEEVFSEVPSEQRPFEPVIPPSSTTPEPQRVQIEAQAPPAQITDQDIIDLITPEVPELEPPLLPVPEEMKVTVTGQKPPTEEDLVAEVTEPAATEEKTEAPAPKPEPDKPAKPPKPSELDIFGYIPPKKRGPTSLATVLQGPTVTTGFTSGLGTPRAPGEIESEVTGKKRRNVWNEASLRLKDALGL